MSLSDLSQYIQDYNKAIYRVRASGHCPPSVKQWAYLEASIDFEFPTEFREFSLSPMSGLCVEVYEELWDRPPEIEEGLLWLSQFSVKTFGIGFGLPTWLDLREELNALPKIETDLIPFMALGNDPDRYCFDLDLQIIRWSPNKGERTVIDGDFHTFLLQQIKDLEERYEQWQVYRKKKSKKAKKKKKK